MEAIETKDKKICVLGLGYIGLPTAAMFATHGYKVVGVDIKNKVVTALNQGKVTIEEPYLDIMVQAVVRLGNLVAKTQPEERMFFIIAVPTPITKDKKADITSVISATGRLVPYLKQNDVVILESTSPTGTIKEVMIPILKKTGLKIGEELFIGHSPERVLPGKILMELVNNNRIVGGINRISSEKIRDLYKTFVNGEIYITDETTAEMCKMMENTFRDVNIALANELAILCEKIGIDAWEVIKLCNKHPRVNIHELGPGVGGHCLAVDPWFIVEKNPDISKIIKLSRQVNDNMPTHVLNKIDKILKDVKGIKVVTILGITYKANIDDIRESPIIKLIELMESRKDYEIRIIDPHVNSFKYKYNSIFDSVTGCDLVVLAVGHNEFSVLPYSEMAKLMKRCAILDTRNFIDKEEYLKNGFQYYLLGAGN